MVDKWNLPAGTIPAWLDPASEVKTEEAKPGVRGPFVIACMEALIRLGCSETQAAEVAANAINETGWGRSYRAWNLGGWKITKAYTTDHPNAPWWRAPGNKSSGDAPWCYYRAFDSLQDFLREWLEHFTPRPSADAPYPGYRRTGELFWAGGPWFPELILVGYKGAVTKARLVANRRAGKPDATHPSVRDHQSIVQSVLVIWHARTVERSSG